MQVGDLIKHNKKKSIGIIIKHQILDYYTVLWNTGIEQHSVKSNDFEVINASR